ncbi:RNA methyltransferase [Williamsia sp. CHRR-6]|uniref:TrmH family RNA methyltransferase n=1 Tax=Williamsia sp. CHRR-6 TaxID=2835871 RepID=UPI001BDB0BC6|nr:RNA methyltransferase [Williamsia sp. CHRR-6]MBT0565168.1 RNA methyltransferase [Williamsia sp. CHRR-6]
MDTALTERSTRVVSFAKLHRASERRDRGFFLVEGANAVDAAIASGRARVIIVSLDHRERHATIEAAARSAGLEVLEVTARAAAKLADTETTPGVFAVCALLTHSLTDVLADSAGGAMLAVAVGLSDPGNAGTLIRTADAMGAAGVLLIGPGAVDPHNGKCVRSSAGSVFHLPVVRERDVAHVMTELRGVGFTTLATTVGGELSLDEADDIIAGPVAWLFGNEAHGLPEALVESADHRVSIPIVGGAESLNIAAAAAICMYAGARARRRPGL